MSCTTRRPCFCMEMAHYDKSFSVASSRTGVGPVLFSYTFYLLSYLQTYFACDTSCMDLCCGFVNITRRVTLPLIFCVIGGHHLYK